jgi:hypothetical protein
VIALLRYQSAILLRSHRWIIPALLYAVLVGTVGSASSLASGLTWSAAILVPAVAILTRSMLTAEPDAARAIVAAARGPVRAQLAALLVALAAGVVLALAGAIFELAVSDHESARTFAAGLLVAAVCLLVGSAAGALCNPPLLRHPGASLLSTLTVVVLALVSGVSPAAVALKDTGPGGDQGALALPHWPGLLPLGGALGLLALTWAASMLVAARRDSRGASSS